MYQMEKAAFFFEGLPGVEYGNGYVSAAINSVIPGIGKIFVAGAIFCFAFVALLAYYLYSESNLLYIFKENKNDSNDSSQLVCSGNFNWFVVICRYYLDDG